MNRLFTLVLNRLIGISDVALPDAMSPPFTFSLSAHCGTFIAISPRRVPIDSSYLKLLPTPLKHPIQQIIQAPPINNTKL